METILVNRTGKVRRATWNGREYLVAPLSSIVADGVLNGSKGSLFYPRQEISRNVSAWDGMPITVYHPTDPISGEHLSANDAGVLDRQGIGFLHNTTFKGKLRHEGWFDVERTKEVDPRVLNALLTGKPMELSTGLFTDNDPTPGVAPNGRAYSAIARNHRPDHLAILPDQIGACSISDGCGVLVNSNQEPTVNRLTLWQKLGEMLGVTANADLPRHPKTQTFQGLPHNAAKKGFTGTDETLIKPKPVDDDDEALNPDDHSPESLIKPKPATQNAFGQEPQPQQVSHMEPQEASKQAAMASMSHEPARAPALQAMDAAKAGNPADAAKAHLQAAKVHDKAATSAFANKEPGEAQDHVQAAALHRAAAGMQQATCNAATVNAHSLSGASKEEMKAAFAHMDEASDSAKSESGKAFKASDHANRTGSAGAHRAAAAAHRDAAAAHREEGNKEMAKGHSDAAKSHMQKANAASKGTTNMTREQVLETLTANCSCEQDKAALNQLSDATLNAMGKMPNFAAASPDPKTAAEVKKKQAEEDGGDPNAEDDEDTPPAKSAFTGNARDWVASAPPEYRDVLNAGAEAIQRERTSMIQRLTANASGADLKRKTEALAKKSREQLREMISYLPPVQTRNGRQVEIVEPMFLGAAAPTDGLAHNSADDDVLPLPVLNFDDERRKQA